MDTHVHAAPDVFGRSLDDEEVATLYKDSRHSTRLRN
jgi:hypothetical protein